MTSQQSHVWPCFSFIHVHFYEIDLLFFSRYSSGISTWWSDHSRKWNWKLQRMCRWRFNFLRFNSLGRSLNWYFLHRTSCGKQTKVWKKITRNLVSSLPWALVNNFDMEIEYCIRYIEHADMFLALLVNENQVHVAKSIESCF